MHGVSETKACKYRSAGRLPPPAVYFPHPTGHPERQRRISAHAVSDTKACKYQSAGRHQTIRRQTSENSILERKRDNPAAFGGIQNLSPPKGWQRNWIRRGAKRPENPVTCFPVEKRLTTFCASPALLHPLLSLTHWIFRSLTLPYKSSSLVQNVFAEHRSAQGAADWRSGPRWSILSVLCPVHPLPLRGVPLKGKRENRWHWILCHI